VSLASGSDGRLRPGLQGGATPLVAIALVVLVTAIFASIDTASQIVVLSGVPVLLALWVRYVLQALATTLVVVPLRGGSVLRTGRLGLHALRGVLLASGSLFLFMSLQHVSVGEMTAIMMIAPLVVTGLAGVWLREHVSPLRWLLVVGGFAGTLVIIRPGADSFSPALLLPLGQVACNAGFQLLTSRLARTEDPMTLHLYTGWAGTVFLLPALAFVDFAGVPAWVWWTLLGIGIGAAIGHFLLILAYQRVPASQLMPYMYGQIGFAMLGGWLTQGRVPDGWSLAGIGLIAACGLGSALLTMRERGAG
jgi:drug/metabolite transporter (DMT)-like permease